MLTKHPSYLTSLQSFSIFDPEKDSKAMIPEQPGVYAILLRHGSHLPSLSLAYTPCIIDYNGEEYELIYVGRSNDSLRNREYDKYFTKNNSGQSTFRKSVGSMLGLEKTYRSKGEISKPAPKTKFTDEEERKLTDWINANTLFLFKAEEDPEHTKTDMIQALDPILNLEKTPKDSPNKSFRLLLKELRNDFL